MQTKNIHSIYPARMCQQLNFYRVQVFVAEITHQGTHLKREKNNKKNSKTEKRICQKLSK